MTRRLADAVINAVGHWQAALHAIIACALRAGEQRRVGRPLPRQENKSAHVFLNDALQAAGLLGVSRCAAAVVALKVASSCVCMGALTARRWDEAIVPIRFFFFFIYFLFFFLYFKFPPFIVFICGGPGQEGEGLVR